MAMFKPWALGRSYLLTGLVAGLFLAGIVPVPHAVAQTAAAVTATCKDGTTFTGKTKRGACAHHGGVQSFDSAAAPAQSNNAAGAPAPVPATATATATAPKSTARAMQPSSGQVWVNTASGVYHCPGTRYYGKTKVGEYMSEAAAHAKNYRPSNGKVCT